LLEERAQTHRSIILVLTSNRGLCGGYNGNVLRAAAKEHEVQTSNHPVDLEVSGKRGIAYFRYRKITPSKTYLHFEDKPTFDQVEELANRYMDAFLAKKIDKLDVVYTRFLSTARQEANIATLLPMTALGEEEPGAKRESAVGEVDYEFLPSAEDILAEIVPVSFKVCLFKCFLDAAVSEQIARMVAMKGATENAGNLIRSLTRKYNRARQSQITSELSEIIGTAEALK
jgi:F-type H+-transporting ATPase subunit gamma